jgi:hypothetical protein
MNAHVGRKRTTASIIAKSMSCIYVANFKLKVTKHAEETNNCKAAWKFCYIKECARLDEVKTSASIIKRSKLILKCIYWAQALEFQVGLMLEKCRNGLVTRQTV